MKRPHIVIDNETHALLKTYSALKRKSLFHVGNQIIRSFLETQHDLIESEGNMIIEEERKPRIIVEVLGEKKEEPRRFPKKDEEEETLRRSLKDIEIVKKGNRYIVKKKRS